MPNAVRNRVPACVISAASSRTAMYSRGEGTVSWPVFECNGHDSVEHLGDPGRREAEVAVPAGPYRRNQSRLGEFRQMGAGGLRRDTRSMGQFGGGKGAAIEKRREHGRSCRLSDQASNLGYQWPGNHRRNVAPGTAGPQGTRSTVRLASKCSSAGSTASEVRSRS